MVFSLTKQAENMFLDLHKYALNDNSVLLFQKKAFKRHCKVNQDKKKLFKEHA